MREAVGELQAGIGNVMLGGSGKLRAACGFVGVTGGAAAVQLLRVFRHVLGSGQS